MKRRRVLFIRLSQFKIFIRKVLIAVLFVSALALMMFSKADVVVVDKTSEAIGTVFYPIIRVMQLPAQIAYAGYEKVRDISRVYSENQQLKKETAQLLMLKNQIRTLKVENKLLGDMLAYTPPPEASYVTAKVVAEEGDGFSHSLIAYVGNPQQVMTGQVVLGEEGVVGRVETVSGHYARIILITDINSKIPVIIERSRVRGILSGDNTTIPKLLFTAKNSDIKVGDVVVTSGVAGTFPVGLPIGKISMVSKEAVEVETTADIERLEFIKIIDYGIYNDVLKIKSESKDDINE